MALGVLGPSGNRRRLHVHACGSVRLPADDRQDRGQRFEMHTFKVIEQLTAAEIIKPAPECEYMLLSVLPRQIAHAGFAIVHAVTSCHLGAGSLPPIGPTS